MTEFIKHHGFSAHNHRRKDVGTAGASLDEIRKHLLEVVPGLREMGISKHTISRLMEPPRKGTIAAARYKSLIGARVPGKKNAYHEDNVDQHYLFARVAYRREFAQKFLKSCAIFSCEYE